ncbi:hypothetical protein [Cupriavidus numazuensis]|uniref:Uncharacterized protein n=1 Tax=Cupriavidus numazuensis TaxID=221992 RepID=A0ABN7Q9Y7_9BURK|nr:hypothetical protein [Cupriavidus numazuensis]CAG2156378.1 hypothetical protein LMG26411_05229 [Cupriavidus numazuensis]
MLEGRLSIIPASGFGDGIRMAYTIAARLDTGKGMPSGPTNCSNRLHRSPMASA